MFRILRKNLVSADVGNQICKFECLQRFQHLNLRFGSVVSLKGLWGFNLSFEIFLY